MLNILFSPLDIGKSLSNKRKNIFATFAVTFLRNGGLNHVIFLSLFLDLPVVFLGLYLRVDF